MPDLTIEHIRTCSQNVFFHAQFFGSNGNVYHVIFGQTAGNSQYAYDWSCDCPAKRFHPDQDCKHITEAKTEKCDWNWQAFAGNHAETETNEDGTCPNCGGETTVIKVGV